MSTWGPRHVTPKTKSVANRMNLKLHQPISPTPNTPKRSTSVLKKKKNKKCTNAWKELKMLVNKAASRIPSAPAVLSPIKRCSSASKIPTTPRTVKTTNPDLRLHHRSNLSTRPTDGTAKTALKKRSLKRQGSKEGTKPQSKCNGQQSTKFGVKKQVEKALNRSDSAATSIDSVSFPISMASPFLLQQGTVKAPTHRFNDGLYNDFAAADPERGECNREDSTACDPPVLTRINEGWPEGRVSIEASSSKYSTLDASRKVEASVATNSDVERECGRCLSACAQASQSADRLLEEITFIQDSTAARKRRQKIPPWIREQYQKSNKGLRSSRSSSSTTGRKTRASSACESKVKSTTRIKRGMRDSPMDAATPLGASYYVNTCTRRRNQTEILDADLTDFFNLRGQTPINFSGSWMHQLQKLAEKDLEAPLQSELRVCLARLAKLEFENRALKELVLLKCGLPKHLGIHKHNRPGTPSTLLEDPENSYTLKSGVSELKQYKVRRPETFDSFHEYFMTE